MGSTLRQREVAKQPLRRVVREIEWTFRDEKGEPEMLNGRPWTTIRELLECGHAIRIKTDWIGETSAERRRCYRCAKGDPPDVEPVSSSEALKR